MDKVILCDKLINKFILRGKKFIEYACFRYGAYNEMISGEANISYVDDFQYFVFTKSTKSLMSIRELLKTGKVEDALIILRSMFEGYLASRYIDEEYDITLLNDFLFVPQQIATRKIIYQDGQAVQRETKELVDYIQRNPSDLKLGLDKKYFYDFYAFLCNYAHCNYSILPYYLDDRGAFTCDKETNKYLAKILTLFVYTKIFESIVTIEGEDFLNKNEEKACYKLVKDSVIYLDDILEYFTKYDAENVNRELNQHMKKMFKNMRKSLKEEIGSVKKDFLN